MSLLQMILLAIVQGLTEFLPVSSSAHLILVPWVSNEIDQGPLLDVMAHLGSLLAVLLYFKKDVSRVLSGFVDYITGKANSSNARLFWYLLLATPMAIIVGGVLYTTGWIEHLRDPKIIAFATIGFAIPLWASDRFFVNVGAVEDRGPWAPILMGLAQALAFIPGTSRSGITMTAARMLGVSRKEAARFSMLMSVPIILALGGAAMLDLLLNPLMATESGASGGANAGANVAPSLLDGLLVTGLSAFTAWIAIYLFMNLVEKIGFLPFVLYRFLLGGALLWLLDWGV